MSSVARKATSPRNEESLDVLLQRQRRLAQEVTRIRNRGKKSDWDLPAAERVQKWGHRDYVGGWDSESWYGIGRHQYHYLVANGLRAHHRFLDVACGSLRLGQFLIPFLDEGNYYGLEGEEILVQRGLSCELMPEVVALKKPRFSFSYDFDLGFIDCFDFAIAQSLFTHLTIPDIEKCFRQIRRKAMSTSVFYFTYFEGDSSDNPSESHANKGWRYSVGELQAAAEREGWKMNNIGGWGHPRNQQIAYVSL
jgi:SAM-dependent methyltransferase